jgi:uncharacterized protein
LERSAQGPPLPEIIAEERQLSHALGGRSVFGWEGAPELNSKKRRRAG